MTEQLTHSVILVVLRLRNPDNTEEKKNGSEIGELDSNHISVLP